jgi:Fe-S oxidoreductase
MDQGDSNDALAPLDVTTIIDDDALWSCTTCGACNEACPVGIEVYDKIVLLRQGRVEAGIVPEAASTRFESMADQYNPFQKPNADRMDWAAGLHVPVAEPGQPIELLYWVGCAGSFDPDGRSVSRAMIKILNHLGLAYHVLGKRERCTGDPVRRMGEEGLFQELADGNVRQLNEHGVLHVLTHCPHCFNTFLNEYPQLHDITFEVEHHSQFLERMITEGKLEVTGDTRKKVTFHDPCYLGRGNGQTEPPREILSALPGLTQVEMPRHGRNSFCCGAGGGSMWLDVQGDDRVENERSAEAANTGAETVVTGCPFCKVMLEAGRQSLEESDIEVLDLAELIVLAEGL